MKRKLNTKVYLAREFYVGLFSVGLGLFLMKAPDRNQDLYLIYPKVVFCGLVLIGGVMVLASLFGNEGSSIGRARIGIYELFMLAVIMLARPLISSAGLYTATFLICFSISILMERDKSLKGILKTLLFDLVLICVLYAAFAVVLQVNAPEAWFI